MSKCLQVYLILTFRYSNLKSKYWKRCEVCYAKIQCVSAGPCPLCRLVLRNVNKTDISILEQTVYYISQYHLLHQNYHCENNETKQIHVLQQLEISKAIDGDSVLFISSIWENHHVPLPRSIKSTHNKTICQSHIWRILSKLVTLAFVLGYVTLSFRFCIVFLYPNVEGIN